MSKTVPLKTSILQPPVPSLPADLSLHGLVAIVTGATSGLGLGTARQLLQHGASEVILAVRSVAKGEAVAASLLSDAAVQQNNPGGRVRVLALDVESMASVTTFVEEVRATVPELHVLLLNAGFHAADFVRTAAAPRRERALTAMYLANAVLAVALHGHMAAAAARSGRQARVVLVGSRLSMLQNSLAKHPLGRDENVLDHYDDEKNWSFVTTYGDVKLLCYAFVDEMARRLELRRAAGADAEVVPVAITLVCPGQVKTDLTRSLPWYLKPMVNVMMKMRARDLETGCSILTHSVAIAKDKETNGAFFYDMDIGQRWAWFETKDGKDFIERLWKDTLNEIRTYVTIPADFEM